MTAALPLPTDSDDVPPDDLERFLRGFWRLVRWALPDRFRFFGLYEYLVVQAFDGPTLVLQATTDTRKVGLDDIPKAQAWPGIAGVKVSPTPGSRVLVQFINGHQGRPIVVAWAPSADAGWLPTAIVYDAQGPITIGGQAPAVNVGGPGGQALTQFPALATWAGNVNTALNTLGQPIAALSPSAATTKAKGL